MSTVDPFLREMQEHCIRDCADHIQQMRDSLLIFSRSSKRALEELMKACHSLKGNLQAVGFLTAAEFLHDFESALTKLNTKIIEAKASEDDLKVIEFFISDAIQACEIYFKEIEQEYVDKAEFKEKKVYTLTAISSWEPSTQVEVIPSASVTAAGVPESVQTPVVSAQVNPPTKLEEVVVKTKSEKVLETQGKQNYLLIKNGASEFAIPVDKVVEVVRGYTINSLPYKRDDVVGLMNLRSEVIPIMNFHDTFQRQSHFIESEKNSFYVVICKRSESRFGFTVDQAEQVVELEKVLFQEAKGLSAGTVGSLVSHFLIQDDKMILIMDPERAFAS